MRDPEVERAQHDRPLQIKRPVGAEVLPQPERDLGKLEPAAAAAAVADLVIPVRRSDVSHGESLPPRRGSAPARPGAPALAFVFPADGTGSEAAIGCDGHSLLPANLAVS